ncbi:MAG: hypothetical protein ACE5E6_07695 [Phycisphaerae bacterium]
MVIGSDELEQLSDGIYQDRIIPTSLYCGTCGYNLRMLRYVGVCPECGHAYNARPLKLEGIFLPHLVEFPAGDAASFVFSGIAAAGLLRAGIAPFRSEYVFVGLAMAAMAVAFLRRTYVKACRFIKFRHIARKIAFREDD